MLERLNIALLNSGWVGITRSELFVVQLPSQALVVLFTLTSFASSITVDVTTLTGSLKKILRRIRPRSARDSVIPVGNLSVPTSQSMTSIPPPAGLLSPESLAQSSQSTPNPPFMPQSPNQSLSYVPSPPGLIPSPSPLPLSSSTDPVRPDVAATPHNPSHLTSVAAFTSAQNVHVSHSTFNLAGGNIVNYHGINRTCSLIVCLRPKALVLILHPDSG